MPIFKNKIIIYIVSRYLTYALQFLLSLAIAVKLGPFYLGVYGMINLIISYFTQVNFGIPHALNVFLVHNKNNRKISDKYSYNALTLYTYFNVLIIIIAICLRVSEFDLLGKYKIDIYIPIIIIISFFTYYNSIFTTIIRVRNKVVTLSIVGSIGVVLNLFTVWFFKGENLVLALTVVNSISCILATAICLFKGVYPIQESRQLQTSIQIEILKKGIYLFLYNSCFYFILISIRTIISTSYSIEEFGYFTFSFTIANAVMLMLDSLNTILFPKTIDMLSTEDSEQKAIILEKMRIGYISTSHLLVYLAMICFPILVWFMPKYSQALTSMNLIALATLMNTNSYGYSSILIAQNKEKKAGIISSISLIINILLGVLLAYVFTVNFSYVILATLVAYMVSSYLMAYESDNIIRGHRDFIYSLKHFFPFQMLLPYLAALIISCFQVKTIIFLPFLIFIVLNFNDLKHLKGFALKLIKKPEVIDV